MEYVFSVDALWQQAAGEGEYSRQGRKCTEIQLRDTTRLLGEMATEFIDVGDSVSGARGRSQISEIMGRGVGVGVGRMQKPPGRDYSPKDFGLYTTHL